MEVDDLVAHRQADAAAPGLGGALVEFLLYEGQFLRRDAGAEVPDADHLIAALPGDGRHDALAASAVLGGVVQHVAEHLLQPLRIAGDRCQLLAAVVVFQPDALLPEQLLIGENGVLELRLQVHLLDAEGEPAVLHLRELQQLLHHGGQAAGLVQNDADAPAHLHRVAGGVLQDRLSPAVDGGQGRAQLMGDRGDKFALHLLVLADLQGHVVDVVHQFSQLVRVLVLQLEAIAAGGDALGRLRHHRHRLHHIVDEQQVGDDDQRHAQRGDQGDGDDRHQNLPVHQPQRGHQPQDAPDLSVGDQRVGYRHDYLSRLRVLALKRPHFVLGNSLGDILRSRSGARGQAGGRDHDAAAVAVQELQLDSVLVRIVAGGLDRLLVVAVKAVVHEVVIEGTRLGLGLLFQAVPHGIEIVVGNAYGKKNHHQDQQHQYRQYRVENPALAKAPQTKGLAPCILLFFRHGTSSFRRSLPLASSDAAGEREVSGVFPQSPHL